VTSKIGGIDVSILTVEVTAANLTKRYPELGIKTVESDARDIKAWSHELPWHSDAGLFSLWFVLHEFSQNDPQIVIEFLDEIRRCYPTAEIMLRDSWHIFSGTWKHCLSSARKSGERFVRS